MHRADHHLLPAARGRPHARRCDRRRSQRDRRDPPGPRRPGLSSDRGSSGSAGALRCARRLVRTASSLARRAQVGSPLGRVSRPTRARRCGPQRPDRDPRQPPLARLAPAELRARVRGHSDRALPRARPGAVHRADPRTRRRPADVRDVRSRLPRSIRRASRFEPRGGSRWVLGGRGQPAAARPTRSERHRRRRRLPDAEQGHPKRDHRDGCGTCGLRADQPDRRPRHRRGRLRPNRSERARGKRSCAGDRPPGRSRAPSRAAGAPS